MSTRSNLSAALFLSLLVSGTASAQTAADRPGVVLFANAGGSSALTDLNAAGASLNTGWTGGGGIGWQLNRYIALRGTFDFARAKAQDDATGFSGQRFNQYFYGGDVQLRYPTANRIAPYALLGAGAATVDNMDAPGFHSVTKFAGKGGLGVDLIPSAGNLGLFAQGVSYLYKPDRNGVDKTQANLLWTAGVSYRL
ncbi:MAG TPA: outer membrane beta-barrel protein [Gemmatimonadales bacterium]|nr:outer membrane beta-barrel protein [Gemmatimonadales bacterium]